MHFPGEKFSETSLWGEKTGGESYGQDCEFVVSVRGD